MNHASGRSQDCIWIHEKVGIGQKCGGIGDEKMGGPRAQYTETFQETLLESERQKQLRLAPCLLVIKSGRLECVAGTCK
jgi:hypothetical protein